MYLFYHYPMRSSATVTVEGEFPIKIRYERSVTGWTSEGTDPEPEQPQLAFDPFASLWRIAGSMCGKNPVDGYDPADIMTEMGFVDLPEDDDALDAMFGLGESGDPEKLNKCKPNNESDER